MPYAHPTVDHYMPLFITLGAAEREDQPVHTTIEGLYGRAIQALVPGELSWRNR